MKIVTWNCNGAFRKKRDALLSLEPDIWVIQECEDPSQSKDQAYVDWANAHHVCWVGENKHKGLAVFTTQENRLKRLRWWSHGYELFLPCLFNENTLILAVWTKPAARPSQNYVVQLWNYLEKHRSKLKGDCVVLGDFNSNTFWDDKYRIGNHSQVVQRLNQRGLTSCYHSKYLESHGSESIPTFFLYKDLSKPYHLDYIFLSKSLAEHVTHFEVGDPIHWLPLSDHMPLISHINA